MELYDQIKDRIDYLKAIIKEKEKALIDVPAGSVQINVSNEQVQYYFSENGKRRYLKASEKELARALCQKDYDKKVLKNAIKELNLMERLYENCHDLNCDVLYENLHKERQKMITPIVLSDEEFIREWEAFQYKPKELYKNAPEFYTDKDERVRSKSEVLIANTLKKYNVPYRYEAPLHLDKYGIIHPDFTALNVRTRDEIYWEHLGKMDDPGYAEDNIQKITAYERNGIFPGKKLVLTYETRKTPIHLKLIDAVIQEYLL